MKNDLGPKDFGEKQKRNFWIGSALLAVSILALYLLFQDQNLDFFTKVPFMVLSLMTAIGSLFLMGGK